MNLHRLFLPLDQTRIELEYLHFEGKDTPLLCLHGFGSTKEDYADLLLWPDMAGRSLLLVDAPGFGQSRIEDHSALSIGFLVESAISLCDAIGVEQFHLLAIRWVG